MRYNRSVKAERVKEYSRVGRVADKSDSKESCNNGSSCSLGLPGAFFLEFHYYCFEIVRANHRYA